MQKALFFIVIAGVAGVASLKMDSSYRKIGIDFSLSRFLDCARLRNLAQARETKSARLLMEVQKRSLLRKREGLGSFPGNLCKSERWEEMNEESDDFVLFDGNFGCDIAIRRVSFGEVLVGPKR